MDRNFYISTTTSARVELNELKKTAEVHWFSMCSTHVHTQLQNVFIRCFNCGRIALCNSGETEGEKTTLQNDVTELHFEHVVAFDMMNKNDQKAYFLSPFWKILRESRESETKQKRNFSLQFSPRCFVYLLIHLTLHKFQWNFKSIAEEFIKYFWEKRLKILSNFTWKIFGETKKFWGNILKTIPN